MNCKLCGKSEISEINARAQRYYHCANCGLIFIDEKGVPGQEKERKRYLEHNNTRASKGYVKMFEHFIDRLVAPYQNGMHSALDFGCGPVTVLADLLEKRGLTVDVYDPYFFPRTFYKKNRYDLITATEVLEHLYDPHKELDSLKNHLNENGYLAVRTMFHPGPEKFSEWWYIRDPTHICFYNSKTFQWIADHFSLKPVFGDGKKFCLLQKAQSR
ncbi:MAG: class I SAM-dependent methyltransferase [Desulfosalsimonas sp.]